MALHPRCFPLCLISVALTALCSLPAISSAAGPMSDAGILNMLKDRIDVQKAGVAIVVGIIDQKGRRIISYGPADRRSGRPADGDTIFEIGSVTKLFTSLLLADMAEKGEVQLTDPVQMYLPAKVVMPTFDGRQITLSDLARHQSSLPREPGNLKMDDHRIPMKPAYTTAQLYAFLSAYKMDKPIGTELYSNLGYGLLGHALALRTGVDFEQLVQQRITGPLGMADTRITATPAMLVRRTTGYFADGSVAPNYINPVLGADGALKSSANDMLTFISAAAQLISSPVDAAITRMKQPFADTPEASLGWSRSNWRGSDIWAKNGKTYGYSSLVAFDKRNGMRVVVLSNSPVSVDDIGIKILNSSFPLKQVVPPSAFKHNLEVDNYHQVVAAYEVFRHRDTEFHLDEAMLNEWGYTLMNKRKSRQAIELLKLGVYLRPASANTYDSLAVAYEQHGDIALAIANYRKALLMEPGNAGLDAHQRLKVLAPGR